MLNIKLIRENPEEIEKKLKTKQDDIQFKEILELDSEVRNLQAQVEALKAKKNYVSKEIGEKIRKKEDVSNIKDQMGKLSDEIIKLDNQLKNSEKQREDLLSYLPNIPFNEIPVSDDPKDNVCIKEYKEKQEFNFPFKNHLELNEKLNLFDFKNSAKISGANWPLYTSKGAKLEWALLNYMIDIHIKNGFNFILPPLLVKEDIMYGSGQLPKFKDQLFKIKDDDYNLHLIPTAEVVLNGLHYNEIIPKEKLPLKYVSYTPCFRREAGAAGKQERGLIRMHQFNKVEMFCLTTPDTSNNMFDEMIRSAEEVLQGLELHYRNMLLVTKDMSFASAKTIDIEVWLPGQDRYYEVSSVSNCTDFQARRSLIRSKEKEEKPELVHTLNGSGVATSRLMVALLENNQKEDGTIIIPKALQKYYHDDLIKPNSI
jgi:seryl-tRNA synthetase